MTVWLVISVDDGVLGAYPTRAEAVKHHAWGPVRERHKWRPGSYSYVTGEDEDDTSSFNVERDDVAAAGRDGWEDAWQRWVDAGRPMGQLTEPLGRQE